MTVVIHVDGLDHVLIRFILSNALASAIWPCNSMNLFADLVENLVHLGSVCQLFVQLFLLANTQRRP